jgi:amidophosphoribosyltransferase
MCGIVGIYSHKRVAEELYDSLINLQHRGQDAAGILTCQQRFDLKQGLGLVKEIFNKENLAALNGTMGIAHTRYPTAGGYGLTDVQPVWLGNPRGIALAHNGNLVNYKALHQEIIQKKHKHLNSTTDSEVLLHLLADGLDHNGITEGFDDPFFTSLCAAVHTIYEKARGSFSIVSVILGKGLLAFRDPHGLKPLVMGERTRVDGSKDYIFASETTMFYSLGFESLGDVKPGELVFVNLEGKLFRQQLVNKTFAPCIFEYVYFARPDGTLDGISVYQSRLRMGQQLAQRWKALHPDIRPDVVIPAPFTSNTAALAFAQELGLRYCEGLYKNHFIGRVFIMPDEGLRTQNVRYKLTPQSTEIEGKNVLILDDSIVRGTTSREIVKMVREHGAKKVYFVSACPPLIEPCFYGIDFPSRSELLAANNTLEEIAEFLDVDQLMYQTMDDLVEAVTSLSNSQVKTPCMACMNGKYITGGINDETRQKLEKERHQSQENA